MSTTFRPYVPDQSLLLPPDVREWLPEGHLAHHVSDLVDGLDLTAFYALYEGDGRRNAPYEPRMMVKVLLYAYATGVFSSRRVARKLEEDVGFRVLAAGNFPQHRTLWCARLTGEGQPVEVRRKEGVTNHFRPESCAGRCEAAGEALTGARTGRAIEHRKRERLERRDCHSGRRQHRHHRNGEGMAGSCARLTGEG